MSHTIAQNAHHRISSLIRSRVAAIQEACLDDDTGTLLTDDKTQAAIRDLAVVVAELAKADAAYEANRLTEQQLDRGITGVTDNGLSSAARVILSDLDQWRGTMIEVAKVLKGHYDR